MAVNTTPLTYNGYVTQVATMAVVNTQTTNSIVVGVDQAFNDIIPQMLNYAELRIQRDLDLLPLQTSNTYALTVGQNLLQIPVSDFVTIQTLGVNSGTALIPLLPATKEFLQNVYGDSASLGVPAYFAMMGGDAATSGNTYTNVNVGPYPDSNYPVTVVGTTRMATLYQSATTNAAATGTTFISTYLPDLLVMASLIYISAFQRNFGRMSDDPAMAQSYEGQYQVLVKGAATEEFRKKFEASAWSSSSSSPAATPTR
jgi:hypothetical protein